MVYLLKNGSVMIAPSGVVTLGQVAARLQVLEVACNRCDRRGRLHTARLLAEHGAGLPMPELRRIIAANSGQYWFARIRMSSPRTKSSDSAKKSNSS